MSFYVLLALVGTWQSAIASLLYQWLYCVSKTVVHPRLHSTLGLIKFVGWVFLILLLVLVIKLYLFI